MRVLLVLLAAVVLPRIGVALEVGCPARLSIPTANATYYEPTIGGACSLPTPAGSFYAAIALPDYAGSEMCGRCVRVTGPEGAITAQIVDVCTSPACTSGHIDLMGEAAFDAVADPILGFVPILWSTVACDVGTDTMQIELEGSNPFYLKVQVQNHRHGIATLELANGASWIPMTRTLDDHFEYAPVGSVTAPLRFRITDVHGQSVETGDIAIANAVPQDTGVQLAPCPEPIAIGAALTALMTLALTPRRSRQ